MKNILNILLIVVVAILIYFLNFRNSEFNNQQKELVRLKHNYDSSQNIIDSMQLYITSANIWLQNEDNMNIALIDQYKKEKSNIDLMKQRINRADTIIRLYNSFEIENSFKKRYPLKYDPNDSIVTIGKAIGQASLIDLAHYDSLQLQIPMYMVADSILNLRIANRDSVISKKDEEINDYNRMIANYSNQRQILIDERNMSDKALKKSKTKSVISQITAAGLLILLILK
jgi:uncharacterized protein YxeA